MARTEKQIVILGGGCGGLWLLYELCRRGYSALLVDHQRLGAYASTRNQSWLHTGSLYAVMNAARESEDPALIHTARDCKRASEEVRAFCRQFCPDALEQDSECLFLFNTEKEANEASRSLEKLELPARVLPRTQFEMLEPVLSPAQHLRFGLVTQDIAFDSHRILAELARQAANCGAEFCPSSTPLSNLHIDSVKGTWIVEVERFVAEAPVLICAVGALTPEMLWRLIPGGGELNFDIQKCLVCVLHQRICNRIIAVRTPESNYLNLVPFSRGTTVNLGSRDQRRSARIDLQVDPRMYKEYAEELSYYVPAIVGRLPCETHFYVCQKLSNTDFSSHPVQRFGNRHFFWLERPNNCFFFYPGKFTLAPVASVKLIECLVNGGQLGTVKAKGAQVSDPLCVSQRPYYNRATHVLTQSADGMTLTFEAVKGQIAL